MTLSLLDAAQTWLAHDPDPATQAHLAALVRGHQDGDASSTAELTDGFAQRLTFGTAGLRAAMGPGPNRMNRVTVSQAAAGLALWLKERTDDPSVLIGFDARHNSSIFAQDTAEILTGYGVRAVMLPVPLPTPLVPFAIKRHGFTAGVVVTASHNPAADNGYKVYVGPHQIVPPTDAEIAAAIEHAAAIPFAHLPRGEAHEVVDASLWDAYVERAASLVTEGSWDLHWVYTPMHGVGFPLMRDAAALAGFPAPHVVAEQVEPDPNFPTVAFPNPEEPEAMDLALDLARAHNADLAIANDPDADRCAAAAPFPDGWRMLSGDELGALLADDALRQGRTGTYACSLVSSTLLADLAAAHGQPFEMTLTGFKWIGRVPGLAFGYEEAIGYCTDPDAVPDKDGITAAIRLLDLAARLKADGLTIADRLDDIARRYGVYRTSPLTFRVTKLSLIGEAMARLRAHLPSHLAGEAVQAYDLTDGWNGLPPTDGVLLEGDSVRVVIRPSGTEPKLKCYLQAKRPPGSDLVTARAQADASLLQIKRELTALLGI